VGWLLFPLLPFFLLGALERLKVSGNETIELIGVSGNFRFGESRYTAWVLS